MDYRLIAIDMDGTLLNSNKEISDRTFRAIQKAVKKGIHIVLSTGRLLKSAQLFAEDLKLEDYILACNGAIIVDGAKNIVYRRPMNLETVKIIMDLGKKHKIYNHFYDEERFYSNVYLQEIVDYYSGRDQKIDLRVFEHDMEILDNNDLNIYKFLFIDNDLKKLEKLRVELSKLDIIGITKSWSNNIEVMGKDVSKGSGLKFLCKKLDISHENVIAIGDNENDLSMISFAGFGVCMGNGDKIVKDRADYITSTNDEDGVATVIEKFVL